MKNNDILSVNPVEWVQTSFTREELPIIEKVAKAMNMQFYFLYDPWCDVYTLQHIVSEKNIKKSKEGEQNEKIQ